MLTEVANYARALVAALGMRAFGLRSGALDGMRGMVVFLVFAAGLGPAVGRSSAAPRIVVTRAAPPTTCLVWEQWFLSNALTALTFSRSLLTVWFTICTPSARCREAVARGAAC